MQMQSIKLMIQPVGDLAHAINNSLCPFTDLTQMQCTKTACHYLILATARNWLNWVLNAFNWFECASFPWASYSTSLNVVAWYSKRRMRRNATSTDLSKRQYINLFSYPLCTLHTLYELYSFCNFCFNGLVAGLVVLWRPAAWYGSVIVSNSSQRCAFRRDSPLLDALLRIVLMWVLIDIVEFTSEANRVHNPLNSYDSIPLYFTYMPLF